MAQVKLRKKKVIKLNKMNSQALQYFIDKNIGGAASKVHAAAVIQQQVNRQR